MKKKNLLKLILDICMVIVLVLMYNKRSISMSFHEIGGLILLGVFIIHIVLNGKWVVVVTKKLFDPTLPLKSKFGYILSIFILVAFVLTGVSGIMISKTLFHFTNKGKFNWSTIHYTSSAVALVLIGIHIGMHKKYIGSIVSKIIKIPKKAATVTGILLTLIIFTYGCYSLTTTNFLNWITMPFTSGQISGTHNKGDFRGTEGNFNGTERPDFPSGENESMPSDVDGNDGLPSDTEGTGDIPNGEKPSMDGSGSFERPSGFVGGKEMLGGVNQSSGVLSALKTIGDFFAITFVFATITVLVEMLFEFIKRKNKFISTELVKPTVATKLTQISEPMEFEDTSKVSEPSDASDTSEVTNSTEVPDPSEVSDL